MQRMPDRDSGKQAPHRPVAEYGAPGTLNRFRGAIENVRVFDLVDDLPKRSERLHVTTPPRDVAVAPSPRHTPREHTAKPGRLRRLWFSGRLLRRRRNGR
jgi:hypothetical protein